MKCRLCKINEARKNAINCSDRCTEIRIKVLHLIRKVTPINGCDSCRGDLHQGCTDKCKQEFKDAHVFSKSLYALVRKTLKANTK